MAVTLQHIAQKLGVSKSAVSLTLRGHPRSQRFSAETRHRIEQAARELGYRPNFFAAQLARETPNLVMVCVNQLDEPWSMRVAQAIQDRALLRGYRPLICSFHEHEDPLLLQRDILSPQSIAGMLVLGSNTQKLTDAAVSELADAGVKIVLVGRETDCLGAGQVLCDNHQGGWSVAEHVYAAGPQEVWLLHIPESAPGRARAQGVLDYVKHHGLPLPRVVELTVQDLVLLGRCSIERAYHQVGHWPQAIISDSDITAVGAVHVLLDHGWRPGRDVAVTGFDASRLSECCWPALTSVEQPVQEMGRQAIDMLVRWVEQGSVCRGGHGGGSLAGGGSDKILLPTKLILRQSSIMSRL